MLLAGLDIGSTGCKIVVYSEDGTYKGKVYQAYPVRRLASEHEVDAADIWRAVQEVIREAALRYPGICGIGIASFGETFVLLDQDNQPLLPAMLYTDPRGQDECVKLANDFSEQAILDITGTTPSPTYSLPKLMWVKDHRPDIWARTKRICLMEDYIVYLLTGTAQIDYSLAARTMAFDIHDLCWSCKLLDAAGINETLFSCPVPTGTSAGCIHKELCASLGLAEDAIVVSVSHDQVAAAIGSGVFDETCAVDGAGTVECITPVFEECDAAKMAAGNYAIIPYAVPGKYVCYAFSFTGGALVDWYIKTLAGYAQTMAEKMSCDVHAVLEQNFSGGPTGLLVLPHFAGAATPYMDQGSKGAIVGLTVENTQQDIYLACLEGVCYEMRLNLERLQDAGINVQVLRATGGGAKSEIWMQMKADILNIPVTALRSEEAGAAGSAMLVGIAKGVFRDLEHAAQVMVVPAQTYYPRQEAHRAYNVIYQRYTQLYSAVRSLV